MPLYAARVGDSPARPGKGARPVRSRRGADARSGCWSVLAMTDTPYHPSGFRKFAAIPALLGAALVFLSVSVAQGQGKPPILIGFDGGYGGFSLQLRPRFFHAGEIWR